MTVQFPSLLPIAGVAERCHSLVNASRWPRLFAEAELLRTLWDPWKCPADQLPLLAWAWSVDFWRSTWPEHRKRQVIAESPAYHEAKTTVAGYRMALGYVDAQLVRARLPRHALFAGATPTAGSHAAWLSGLPEIRIYLAAYRIKTKRKGRFVGRLFAGSAARVVLGRRRAELHRDGSIQTLVFAGVRIDDSGRLLSDPERLVIPGPQRSTVQAGKRFRGRSVADGRLAGRRVIALSFATGGDMFIPNAVSPGLSAIDAEPRRMWEARPGGQGLFACRSRRRRGVRPNRADEQAYLSIRLADGGSEQLGRMRNRVGRSRLRRKAFTASLLVHAPGPAQRAFPVKGRYVRRGPEERVAELLNAVGVTQAARDTLFVDINSLRPLVYGDLVNLPDDTVYGAVINR